MKLQKIFEVFCENLTHSTRSDGSVYCHLIKEVKWQQEAIRIAHLGRLPLDDIYEIIYGFVSEFASLDEDAEEDDFFNVIYDYEPEVYTYDLMKWLASNVYNVCYLTEAIEDGVQDGYQALHVARAKFAIEVGTELLNTILENKDEIEEEILRAQQEKQME